MSTTRRIIQVWHPHQAFAPIAIYDVERVEGPGLDRAWKIVGRSDTGAPLTVRFPPGWLFLDIEEERADG